MGPGTFLQLMLPGWLGRYQYTSLLRVCPMLLMPLTLRLLTALPLAGTCWHVLLAAQTAPFLRTSHLAW